MRRLDRYTCEQAFSRLDDYLDRELTPEEMQLIRTHLDECSWCAEQFQFNAGVLHAMRERIRHVTAPPDLLARLSSALQKAQEATAGEP